MTLIPPGRDALAPSAFSFLPLGAVKPRGWLERQLRIQARGLSGHLPEFWPDVGPDSAWLGGAGEGWERGPYYLDGLVPLAYLLDDDTLIARVRSWMDYVLSHQHADGWLGPVHDTRDPRHRPYDVWPVAVMLKALTQYQEASGDPRVIPALSRGLAFLHHHLDRYPLSNWGQYRWADLALSIIWLYRRTGDAGLLDLAQRVRGQGYDWTDHFTRFRYPERVTRIEGEDYYPTHVVNNAMGIKAPGLRYLLSGGETDRRAVYHALDNLDRYHGQVTGMFSGDEHLAGRDPTQGTELCAVVEFMFSLENLIAILGDPLLADRLEGVAYNALPATFSPDMWAHQYDQQVNQVLCTVAKRNWTNNGDEANIFGLEPNFGCCTANLHQGWPKLASSLWMAGPGGGLAATAYAPCEVKTTAGGRPVAVVEETDYPFAGEVRFTVRSAEPVEFPIHVRVPAWVAEALLRLPDGEERLLSAGAYHRLARPWQPGDTLALTLPLPVRASRRSPGAVALERGPLVFALKIGEEWRHWRGTPPHADWEVLPTTPWNYGLLVKPDDPERSLAVLTRPVGERPFSPDGAPVHLRVRGRRIPQWTLVQNSAGPLPPGPVAPDQPDEDLTLIPYGCTNLRVAEFPLVVVHQPRHTICHLGS